MRATTIERLESLLKRMKARNDAHDPTDVADVESDLRELVEILVADPIEAGSPPQP